MNNLGRLLFTLPINLKNLFRTFEKKNKKVIDRKWSYKFNEICLLDNLWPTYTNIRHHDPALVNDPHTNKYKIFLIERQKKICSEDIENLEKEVIQLEKDINQFNTPNEIKTTIYNELKLILVNYELTTKNRIIKKLNNLYNGKIKVKNAAHSYVNLSNYEPTKEQKEFLNLGLNYHIQPKYNKIEKSTQLEILYQDLLKLEGEQKLNIHPNLTDQLRNEATKHRNTNYHKSKLTSTLRKAARELYENQDIIIKKADKSSSYVILNRNEYIDKLNTLINNPNKFKLLNKNPTESLKTKANKLITAVNSAQNDIKLKKIIGEYKPGYLYGTVKTHKEGYPLRPIISQVTTPTYHLAKTLNQIISKYIPSKYSLRSSNDFVDLLHCNKYSGHIASLDVESLFTNVPINNTIDIIIELAYNHPTKPPPKIPQNLLKQLLEICTKESPFVTPDDRIFQQVEGVAMGSPLGPTFANFYMGYLEETIFSDHQKRPLMYCRYVDDIFIMVRNIQQLEEIKNQFEDNSILKFTIEKSTNNKLPFLDVLINKYQDEFFTKVYRKETDLGQCLNAESECPNRYKTSVIRNYLNRAYKISSNWHELDQELDTIKQILVNNNFSNTTIDKEIKIFMNKVIENNTTIKDGNFITTYYKSQMHINYKKEERIIKDIIKRNVNCTASNTKLKVIIYYNNIKSSNLVIKNNCAPRPTPLQSSNIVYKFTCPIQNCAAEYVGMTRLTLEKRLRAHIYSGAIKNHLHEEHQSIIDKGKISDNTTILTKDIDPRQLFVKEALYILQIRPKINIQSENFSNVLKLHQFRHNHN